MRRPLFAIAVFISLTSLLAPQTQDSQYQVGTVIAVKTHDSGATHTDTPAFDVTVRVGERDYTILFTSPTGSRGVKFAEGQNVLVRVGAKTLGFRDMMGRYVESPILGSKAAKDTLPPDTR